MAKGVELGANLGGKSLITFPFERTRRLPLAIPDVKELLSTPDGNLLAAIILIHLLGKIRDEVHLSAAEAFTKEFQARALYDSRVLFGNFPVSLATAFVLVRRRGEDTSWQDAWKYGYAQSGPGNTRKIETWDKGEFLRPVIGELFEVASARALYSATE